jgi:2-desacetyl-2-hydroxyethyl bacteriochlorophyllide A dehydrogenase
MPSRDIVMAQALYFVAPKRVEVREIPLKTELDEGQVLVQTEYSGISGGTEMLAYRGELDPDLPLDETIGPLAGTFRYPFRYGYSCAGRVERSRGGAAEGALVVALHPHQDRFVLSEGEVVLLPSTQTARAATLFPLVETALQICLDAGETMCEHVAVLGLGVVGILTSTLLQRSGASVIAAEPHPWRRRVAESLGIRAVAPPELAGEVDRCTAGRGVPLLIELSGQPSALAPGLALLAHEGRALVASWYGTKDVSLPLGGPFHRRRLSLQSTQVSTVPARLGQRWTVGRRRERARDLLEELPLVRLTTHEYPLDQAQEAFDAIDRQEEELLHVALRYG